MTKKELDSLRTDIIRYLKENRLRDAMMALDNASRAELMFDINDKVMRLQQTYAYMLSYMTAGADDPQRPKMLRDLISDLFILTDLLTVNILSRETPTLYYNVRRFIKRQGSEYGVEEGIGKWRESLRRRRSMSSLFAHASQRDADIRTLSETVESELFNLIWTSFPIKKADAESLVSLICDVETPYDSAVRLVSALGLALLEFCDPVVIEALCQIYSETADKDDAQSRGISINALIFLITALYKYSYQTLPSSTKARFEALQDTKSWRSDVHNLFMELVRARDTERIRKTLQDEIIPGVISMRPEIEKKIRDLGETSTDGGSIENNPEWEELLAKSEIGDKLKELNEMQMEGSDVFMGTFSHLKNFPFFNDVINWFTPFSEDSAVASKVTSQKPQLMDFVSMINDFPFLCDSDKYSMLLSVDMMPDSSLLSDQLNQYRDHIQEIKGHTAGITDREQRRTVIRNYIHNFYRFVNLFRRKGEFYNIFKSEMNLVKVPLLKDSLEDPDLLKLVGEFYFLHKYYKDSLAAFTALDEMGEFDATIYQKMGYAYEKIGQTDNAIRYYEQADLLDGSSRWVKMHLAASYKNSDRLNEAIEIINVLNGEYPEDYDISMLSGYTFVSADNYREALKHFYKAEFLRPGSKNVLKAIAWSLFMIKDFARAENYYQRLLLLSPDAEDYLNMGHVALAKSNFKEAINYYKIYMVNGQKDKEMFFSAMENDRPQLVRVGIGNDTVSLIADAMFYELDKH